MESVSGQTWAELVQETYVEPCGLKQFGYTMPFQGANGYPTYLDGDIANVPETANPSMEGGLYTTVEDYGKVLSIHLNGGVCGWGDDAVRVLSAEAVATMQADHIATYGGSTGVPGQQGYGLGWWIPRTVDGLVIDAGAWGAVAWIDNTRRYGAFFAMQAHFTDGADAQKRLQPLIDDVIDTI